MRVTANSVVIFLLTVCIAALFAVSVGFPGPLEADWQQLAWEARTGNVTDYRSWLIGAIGFGFTRIIPDTFYFAVLLWSIGVVGLATAAAMLPTWAALIFIAGFFNPFWPVPFCLSYIGTDCVFLGLFCLWLALCVKGSGWFLSPVMALVRPNAAMSSLYSAIVFGGRKRFFVAVFSVLSLVAPWFVIKTFPSAEFKSVDLVGISTGEMLEFSGPVRRYTNQELYGVDAYDDVFFRGQHCVRTEIHNQWFDAARTNTIMMAKVKLQRFYQFFLPENYSEAWLLVNSSWRDGVDSFQSPGFSFIEKHRERGPVGGLPLGSPLTIIALTAATLAFTKIRISVAFIPIVYMLTFAVANVNFSAKYMAPSMAGAWYLFVLGFANALNKRGK